MRAVLVKNGTSRHIILIFRSLQLAYFFMYLLLLKYTNVWCCWIIMLYSDYYFSCYNVHVEFHCVYFFRLSLFNGILLPSIFYVWSKDSVWRFIPFRFSTTNFSTTVCHWIVAMEVQGRLLQSVLRMLLFTNLNTWLLHG